MLWRNRLDIEKTSIFKGRIIHLNIETVKLPDGRQFELEIVHHPGGAAVVAFDQQEHVCLLRQYRHAADEWLWELPAGKLDPGEDPIETARRELQEEAGIHSVSWDSLGSLTTSPGVFDEVVYLFLARDLEPVDRGTEDDELIEVHWLPLATAIDWACSGKIIDAKTLIGLFRAQAFLAKL